MSTAKVYQAITAVQADLSKIGISKDQKNMQQGFKFRGIDDLLNVIAPILAKHKLFIIPEVVDRETIERQTARGNAMFYNILTIRYRLTSGEDGSELVTVIQAEAMDSADKGINKCLSIGLKYLCIQTFAIPIVGTDDPDAVTPDEVTHDTAKPITKKKAAKPKAAKLDQAIIARFDECKAIDQLQDLWKSLSDDQRAQYFDIKETAKARLAGEAA